MMVVTVACAAGFEGIARPQAAPQHDRRVAVTIDDLPANMFRGDLSDWQEMTAVLLAGLVRHEVPAIGFVNEEKLYVDGAAEPDPAYVALLQAWLDAGLELGNHSYSHPDLHRTPLAQYEQDILRGEIVTRRLLAARGALPRYFRHPYLHTGTDLATRDAVHDFLAEHGYRVAPVTIDNLEYIAARAYDHALLPDDRELAARVASSYVTYMDEMFAYYEQQSEADEFTGSAGITWLHRWAITAGKRGEFFDTEPDLPKFVHEIYADPPGTP